MPAIAVVGAAVAIGVAVEVGTTFAIIAAVGATIGAVGAVTGIKELAIAGAVIGAVGAIGGLASSAGLLGAAAGAEGAAAAGAGAADAVTGSSFLSAGDSIAAEIAEWSTYGASQGVLSGAQSYGTPITDSGTFDVVGAMNGQSSPADVLHTAVETAAGPVVEPQVVQMSDPAQYTAQGGGEAVLQDFGQAAPAAPDFTKTVSGAPAGSAPPPPEVTVTATPPAAPLPATPSGPVTAEGLISAGGGANTPGMTIARTAGAGAEPWWKDILSFAKTQGGGMLGYGVLQAGSAFISGATNQLTPAQIDALRAQADANAASANLARQQQQGLQMQQGNMNAPMPVAVRRPMVTGAPAGLINSPVPA